MPQIKKCVVDMTVGWVVQNEYMKGGLSEKSMFFAVCTWARNAFVLEQLGNEESAIPIFASINAIN